MESKHVLTPSQVAVLRALKVGIVELSPAEVAVYARLLPNQVDAALPVLESRGLVSSWHPITGRTGQLSVVMTGEGQTVLSALAQFRDIPPVGTIVQLPRPFPSFSSWGQQSGSYVEIGADRSAMVADVPEQ